MKIKNKAFWEKREVISTQDKIKVAANYEKFLFNQAIERLKNVRTTQAANVYGCGTGRDIKIVDEYFNPQLIMASDISENMIEGCKNNLKDWNIKAEVQLYVADASTLLVDKNRYDVVTLLNSMLTYVAVRESRLDIFKNSYDSLIDKGVVLGVVHHQIGKPMKTLYFKMRNLFSFILKEKVGNKSTGFKGYNLPGYYYDATWLKKDLTQSGFNNILIYSLEEYFQKTGKKYDKTKGYNQLIFIASK